MTTLLPIDIPTKVLTRRLMTEPLAPTAPRALLPAKFPTTATSALLKSC